MSNIVRKEEIAPPAQAPAPVSESAAILQIIERAALNPAIDIDKMERLLEMQERILVRNAKAAYAAALARMQPELPIIGERGKIKNKGTVQSTYALWEDINEAIRPVLSKHGFALSFRVGREGNLIVVTGVLTHAEGHSEETTMHLPVDDSGAKNAVQAVGSSTSYGKRYTAAALLNLTSRGEDDDGKAAGAGETVTDEQVAAIRELIEVVEADEPKFCKYLKVESLSALPAKRFKEAIDALKAFGRANGKRVG